jgi:hypothetical protein
MFLTAVVLSALDRDRNVEHDVDPSRERPHADANIPRVIVKAPSNAERRDWITQRLPLV